MKFAIIRPAERKVEIVDTPSPEDAEKLAGLKPGEVDHGSIMRDQTGGVAIVVYEYGLFEEPDASKLFALNGHLYAGNAVLYACDDHGETIDYNRKLVPRWFNSVAEIEEAIFRNRVTRPTMSFNDKTYWRWPEKKPHLTGEKE